MQVKYWDLWMGLQLLFTALVTPYQVAFLVTHLDGEFIAAIARLLHCALWPVRLHPLSVLLSHETCAAGLFLMNLVVDASFIVDMALQPFQSYWDEHHDMCGRTLLLPDVDPRQSADASPEA